jgi:hypothetical protein
MPGKLAHTGLSICHGCFWVMCCAQEDQQGSILLKLYSGDSWFSLVSCQQRRLQPRISWSRLNPHLSRASHALKQRWPLSLLLWLSWKLGTCTSAAVELSNR